MRHGKMLPRVSHKMRARRARSSSPDTAELNNGKDGAGVSDLLRPISFESSAPPHRSSIISVIPSMQSTSVLARSCATCRRRKIRCDRNQPTCAYCRKHGLDCEWPPAQKRARQDESSSPAPTRTREADSTADSQPFWAQVNSEVCQGMPS